MGDDELSKTKVLSRSINLNLSLKKSKQLPIYALKWGRKGIKKKEEKKSKQEKRKKK